MSGSYVKKPARPVVKTVSLPGDYLAAVSAAPVASEPAAAPVTPAPFAHASRATLPDLKDLYSGAVVSGSYTKPAKAAVKPAVSMPGDYLAAMGSAAPVASAAAAPAAAAAAPAALRGPLLGRGRVGQLHQAGESGRQAGGFDAGRLPRDDGLGGAGRFGAGGGRLRRRRPGGAHGPLFGRGRVGELHQAGEGGGEAGGVDAW